MTKLSRRMALQLTPLLDLLLIVIFAQYMDVSQETRRETVASTTRAEEAERELRQATAALDRLRSLRADEETAATRLRTENERLRQQHAELTEQLRQAAEQRDLIGTLAADLFRIPDDVATRALNPPGGQRTPEEIEQLRRQFRELAAEHPDVMVKHLLTWNELRKRSDVWDLYLSETGLVTLDTGDRVREFRATTPQAFATQLFEIYKSLPQPKGLVIILLSFGDARAVWREAAAEGLRLAADRMREDSAGRTRFEYALLGFRPRTTPPAR